MSTVSNIPDTIKQSKLYQDRVKVFMYSFYTKDVHKISLHNLRGQILKLNDIILLKNGTAAFSMQRIYQYGPLERSIYACNKSMTFDVYPNDILGIVQKEDVGDYNTLFELMNYTN